MASSGHVMQPRKCSGFTSLFAAGKPPVLEGALTLLCAAYFTFNVAWICAFRIGQPLDIDEAGYLWLALRDYQGLVSGGPLGWLRALDSGGIQAPLSGAAASLIYAIASPDVYLGFLVPILAGVVTLIATFFIGKEILSRRLGFLGALLVASCPMFINYSRDYSFALMATAVTSLVVLALIRSRGFIDIGWSSAYGVLFGLMPLARTMTIAFLPGVVLASLVCAATASDRRTERLTILSLSTLLGASVSALWLWPNALSVINYLVGFGYGKHSTEYGQHENVFSVGSWLETARHLANGVYLPEFAFLLTGCAAAILFSLRFIYIGRSGAAERPRSSSILPIALIAFEGIVALTSTGNKGTGFSLPLLPLLLMIASWGIIRVTKRGWALVSLFAALAALLTVPMSSLTSPIAKPIILDVPILGRTTLSDGRGNIQRYEAEGGYAGPTPTMPIDMVTGSRWVAVSARTLSLQVRGPLAFGFRHRLFNLNTVNLEHSLAFDNGVATAMVDPTTYGPSTDAYYRWLTMGEAKYSCLLLTSNDRTGLFMPAVRGRLMEHAALRAHFSVVERWRLPDAAVLTVWSRAACRTQHGF